jgi:hypothetical protein
LLIGHLHQKDPGAMRPALYQHGHRSPQKPKVLPMSCPQSVTHVLSSCPPRPSPAGRGRIVVRFLSRRATRFSSWFQCIRKNRKGTFHELRDRFYRSLLTSAATRRERLLL